MGAFLACPMLCPCSPSCLGSETGDSLEHKSLHHPATMATCLDLIQRESRVSDAQVVSVVIATWLPGVCLNLVGENTRHCAALPFTTPSPYGKSSWGYYGYSTDLRVKSTCFARRLLLPCSVLGLYSSAPVEVPLNHKRSVCDLTQADRLALYDFVIEETKKKRSAPQVIENDSDLFVDLAAKVNQDNSRKSPKSYLEILAEVRDYKRRRQSYRAKNVHITKKSYTEVIRDVIKVHMEELSNHWQEEQERAEDGAEKNEERRSASVDSRQSGGSYLDVESSRHRRARSRSPHKRKRNKDKSSDSRRRKERRVCAPEVSSIVDSVVECRRVSYWSKLR